MTHVIYHHDDPDGHVAAAVMANYLLSENPNADIRFFAKQYTDTFMDHNVIDDAVNLYFLDLSFTDKSKNKFIDSVKSAESHAISFLDENESANVVWIDHHASTETAVKDVYNNLMRDDLTNVNIKIMFFTELSGCALTYIFTKLMKESNENFKNSDYLLRNEDGAEYLTVDDRYYPISDEYPSHVTFGGKRITIPSFIYHVDNYDRWTKKDLNADEFITGLKIAGYRVGTLAENINPLYKEDPVDWRSDVMIEKGKIALEYQKQVYLEQEDLIGIIQLNNHKVAYKIGPGNSWNFNDLLDDNEVDFAILVRYDPTSNLWVHSFYGNANLTFKVNKLAEALGGGGHPGAAGCQIEDILPIHPEEVFKKYPAASTILYDLDVDATKINNPPYVYINYSKNLKSYDFGVEEILESYLESNTGEFLNNVFYDCNLIYQDDIGADKAKEICKRHLYVIYPDAGDNSSIYFDIGGSMACPDKIVTVMVLKKDNDPNNDNQTITISDTEDKFFEDLRKIYPGKVIICNDPYDLMFEFGVYAAKVINEVRTNN